ncbi:MAG TPA: oligosaccharide flippase family protein [Solirubrobacteraceae bacterium]|nr:oligosaccharide flippase family protein [Solirubrobacteraceae bacterium]
MSYSVADVHSDDVLVTSQAGPTAARGGLLRVGGYVFGAALSIVSAAFLFRDLGVGDGGRYVLATTIVGLFGGLTDAGLWSIAVRELSAGSRTDTRMMMRDIVGLRLVLSTAAAIIAIAFTAVAGYGQVLVIGVAAMALAMVLQNLQLTWSAALAAHLRFGWMAGLDLARQIVSVVGIVLLALAGAGLLPFLLLAVPAAVVALAPTALLVRHEIPLRPRYEPVAWRQLVREVLPYAAAAAAGAIYFSVALILMSLISNDQQTGYFGASFRVVSVLFALPGLIVGSALPIFARAAASDRERLRFGVQRVLDTTTIFGTIIVLGVFVGAKDIIAIVAGPEFEPAAEVLQIQCLGLLGSFVTAVLVYALLSLGRYRAILLLTCGPLILNAALTVALVPAYGAKGAATATATGELLLAGAAVVVLGRVMAPQTIRIAPVVRSIALAVPFAGLALVTGVPSLMLAVVSGGLYLAAVWLLGWLPEGLLRDLRATT